MKKRILISILALVILIFCSGFSFLEEQQIEKENVLIISNLDNFNDKNAKEYSLMELDLLILEQKNNQANAHDLAENARALGWPEDSEPIEFAKIEWGNAQIKIDFYQKIYDEKKAELERRQWEIKKAQYPEATKIWLYMKDLGWNDYVCAGIMGNIMAEVGGQTLNIQEKTKVNGYYGICQWNKNHKKVWGKNLDKQLEYLNNTIKSEFDTYGYAYEKDFNFETFLNLEDEKEAALAFAKAYERCASGSYEIRQENATKAYNYFVK